MSQWWRQAGGYAGLVAGWLLLAGSAAGQGYNRTYPYSLYGNPYYSGAFTVNYYPLVLQTPQGTPIRTYPPSVNYPAFAVPSYNFLFNPATVNQVPTYPPSINYAAYGAPLYNSPYNVTDSVGALATTYLNVSSGINGTGLPSAQWRSHYQAPVNAAYNTGFTTGYNAAYSNAYVAGYNTGETTALSTQGPTVVPLVTSPVETTPVISYVPEGSYLNAAPLSSPSTEEDRSYVARQDPRDTRVRRSNRSTAYIDLAVPPDAEVWFQGVKTKQTGEHRRFTSPPLPRGQAFTYDIRVRWSANGKAVTRKNRLTVRAGDWWRVDMTSTVEETTTVPLETASR
jgi:uncharacterized protein (TIGR03000 family)